MTGWVSVLCLHFVIIVFTMISPHEKVSSDDFHVVWFIKIGNWEGPHVGRDNQLRSVPTESSGGNQLPFSYHLITS